MDDKIALKVSHVSKRFKLPHEKNSSVKNIFVNAVRNISNKRTFEVQHALSDISFEVKKGEFFGIVGRNGSGKSTLLKILAGIYQPSKGKVYKSGRLVPFIELGVGFNPELTGRQNVYLNGALLGFSEKEVDALYGDVVGFAELEDFMDQKLKNYSSGMQVRLAFSVAVQAKAEILLIDEVLAVGDAAFQRKCFDYFKKLKKDKTTVVFVSHNMDAVREYCDRAMLIEKSEIIEVGSTDLVAGKYLKLFMDETSVQPENNTSEDRWGDHAIRFVDVRAKTEKDTISIQQTIEVNEDIENPIAGFRIRDAAGNDVTGTNSKIEHHRLGALKKGESFKLDWAFPNTLSDGTYTVDPALLYDDGVTVADWWNEATSFTVKKNRHIPYMVDPGFTMKLEK